MIVDGFQDKGAGKNLYTSLLEEVGDDETKLKWLESVPPTHLQYDSDKAPYLKLLMKYMHDPRLDLTIEEQSRFQTVEEDYLGRDAEPLQSLVLDGYSDEMGYLMCEQALLTLQRLQNGEFASLGFRDVEDYLMYYLGGETIDLATTKALADQTQTTSAGQALYTFKGKYWYDYKWHQHKPIFYADFQTLLNEFIKFHPPA